MSVMLITVDVNKCVLIMNNLISVYAGKDLDSIMNTFVQVES